jgi:hypothetical protein
MIPPSKRALTATIRLAAQTLPTVKLAAAP